MNIYDVLTDEAEVVVVGLTGRYDEDMRDFTAVDNFDVRSFESTYKAFRYLQNTVPTETHAIICDLATLIAEDYLFVRDIRRDDLLCDLPIIGIDRGGDLSCAEVLRNGVDDCYVAPVSWTDVVERIGQLRDYRRMLRAAGEAERTEDPYRIPRGKRVFDIVFASAAIIAAAPVLLTIAALVKLTSRGPVIYKSKRIGTGYQEFEFLKFRSMVKNADAKVAELQAQNQYGVDGAFFKMKDDPRVTRIGRFIRNTSLDELPQLFNVLRGDMSIVGNRPLPLREAETLTSEEWSERFLAPAGITGLWQTSGRGKDTMSVESRIALDIDYARGYSPLTDLKILVRTAGAMKQEANV